MNLSHLDREMGHIGCKHMCGKICSPHNIPSLRLRDGWILTQINSKYPYALTAALFDNVHET